MELPADTWPAEITKRHSGSMVKFLAYSYRDDSTIADVRIQSHEIVNWAREVRSIKSVHKVEELRTTRDLADLRITSQTYPILRLFHEMRLLLRLPYSVVGGQATLVVEGTDTNINRLLEVAHAESLGIRVEAVHHPVDGRKALLTARQAEIFSRAMSAGYFEVPRGVTLSELANQLGMAPSSLSEILAIVEKKLLQEMQATAMV
jgi:hypothetical protein